jgi:hypothetical protein
LDDIGLDGRRLTLFHLTSEDPEAASAILREIAAALEGMGKNPATTPGSRFETGGLMPDGKTDAPQRGFHTVDEQRRTDS